MMNTQQSPGDMSKNGDNDRLSECKFKPMDDKSYNYDHCKIPAPFYVSHGTCFYKRISEMQAQNDPMLQFREYAESEEFLKFVNASGINGANFVRNPNADPSWREIKEWGEINPGIFNKQSMYSAPNYQYDTMYENFLSVLKSPLLSHEYVALVFHGTRSENIPAILQKGLSPKTRRRQVYGSGEYFSKDPAISVTYAKGGRAILVFAVIVPPPQQTKQPNDFVVVNQNQHQIPLGTLCFETIEKEALERSKKMKNILQDLQNKVDQNKKLVVQAKIKCEIIQYVIQNKIDLAAEKYEKFSGNFPINFNREISMYIHQYFDKDKSIIDYLFPNLPPPFERSSFVNDTRIKSVELQQEEEKSAQYELDIKQAELLNQQALQKLEKENLAKQIKPKIIQHLFQNDLDLAVQKYKKISKDLPVECKNEISMYVYQCLDVEKSLISHLFPDLPPPKPRNLEEQLPSEELKIKCDAGRKRPRYV